MCEICGKETDFPHSGYAIPTADGFIVPNSYCQEWFGQQCCMACHLKHAKWSEDFMYLEYMMVDGRLELSFEELIVYESKVSHGRSNASSTKVMVLPLSSKTPSK